MLTQALYGIKRGLRKVGPLDRALVAVGVVSLGKRAYQALLLRCQRHEVNLMGHAVRFVVTSTQEIERIDSIFGAEQTFVHRMLAALRPGDIFFDVGANIGMISLLIAKAGKASGVIVHAFEPESRNAEELRRNVELNGVGSSLIVHQVALGDKKTTLPLFVTGAAGEGTHSILASANVGRQSIPVAVETASEYSRRIGATPTLVKIDVEGAEMAVLIGMENVLTAGGVRELFVEVHPRALQSLGLGPDSIRTWLESRGYRLAWMIERGSEVHQHYQRSEAVRSMSP